MIVILLLSVLAWAPLLYPGLVQTHSGLGAIYDALSAGAPFSGWLPAYGMPGDGPLATWLLVALTAAIGPVAALKLLYVASFVLAAAGMYLLARRAWRASAAVVAAAVYVFFPYRLAAVYVRGALAEALLLALAPLVVLALCAARRSPNRRNLSALALLVLAASLTHLGLAILLLVFGVIWSATSPDVADTRPRDVWRRRTPYAAAVGGLLAGLLVLLPGGRSILPGAPGWADHFVHFYQLFSPVWGVGESGPGWQDGLSFQLGLAPLALAIVSLWLAYEQRDAVLRRAVLALAALAAVTVALALSTTAPLWRIAPLHMLVAYPYQLLGLAGLPLALLGGAAAYALARLEPAANAAAAPRTLRLTTLAVLLAFVVLASYSYLAPRFVDEAALPDLNRLPLGRLGDEISLLDVRVEGDLRAGADAKLIMIWQALRPPAADYTVFVHLLDAQGAKQGQQDARPLGGNKPTNTWLRGEIVRDEIVLPVAAGATPGQYRLSVGMYNLATMERLTIAGTSQNAIEISPVTVK